MQRGSATKPGQECNGGIISMRRLLLIFPIVLSLGFAQQSGFELGTKYYNQGEYWQALVQFSALSNQTVDQNPQLTASLVMLMKCYAKLESYQRSIFLARDFQRNYPESRYQADVFFLLGEIYTFRNDYSEAAWNFALARAASDRQKLSDEAETRAQELMLNRVPLSDMEVLYSRDLGIAGQFLGLLAIERFQRAGKQEESTDLMFNLRPHLKQPWLIQRAMRLDWTLRQESRQSILIGVILPLSGSYAEIGNQILAGIRYGAMVYSDSMKADVELDVRDNAATLGTSIEIARDFSENPLMVAVVGPLISDNVKAVAAVLNGTGKILLTPTATENDIVDFSRFLYQYQPSRGIRGAALAAYAVNTLGLKTFAVIAPTDAYGRELTDSFTKKVDELGAQILYEGWYAGDPTDLSHHFKNLRSIGMRRLFELVASDSDSVRQIDYRTVLKPITPDSGRINRRFSSGDSLKVKLPTIEGLYMPIHHGQVYVASQVAFYNLNTYVLGDENWDDPDNLNKNRRYLPRLAFASSNSIDSLKLEESGILVDYSMLYDRSPTQYDYLGYDAVNLLLDGLTQTRFNSAILTELLKKMGVWRGITSQVKFGGDSPRQNQSVFIMEYDNQSRLLDPAGYYDQFGFHPKAMILPQPSDSTTIQNLNKNIGHE
ncbi:MAG: hypothetical protein CO167_05190 [Candidatus Marinimicrobia bacterium CG_4_9_14_3_um_filter_48_9]|nr:MAG: hypothetical protein CO167_05190 [Candidatus Marinimicrobia bacterium CG_4_9_14_3_um_filter_48_9]